MAKNLRLYRYAARFEPGDEGGIVVSFPDVPEAITEGTDEADAREQAIEALGLALLSYPLRGKSLPSATASPDAADAMISVGPQDAAKLAVLDAFHAAGISKAELARRIDRDEKEVRRILDPLHPTKLPALRKALAALGAQLVVGVEAA